MARGDEPCELVLTGGRVFSVFTREWLEVDVAIAAGTIVGLGSYQGRERRDVAGAYIVPGLIDAHLHIESSKLTPDRFAEAVVPQGTTAVVADPHEIANVLGTDGVHWLIDATGSLDLDVFVMAPSCVPASPHESPRRPLGRGDLESLLRRRRTLGVAEMMNFPAVIAGDPVELAKLDSGLTEHVDGHAPGVTGPALNAYVAAGIGSDHEATTLEEALEKRRLGMWVMLREASNARNLRDLLPMVRRHGPERCMFCTDDREPTSLVEEGHLNQMLRVAVAEGIAPEEALVMATLHPAEYHGLRHLGAVAPGRQADLLLLDDLRDFVPRAVLKRGREPRFPHGEAPEWVRQTVHVGPLRPDDLAIPGDGAADIRAIGIVPDQLLTRSLRRRPAVREGRLVADPGRDLAKIAVIERHHASGRVGLGFVTDLGLAAGAFASTVAHDAHNLVVIGVDDEDMVRCAERLTELGGGVVVVRGGEVVGELPLPVAGLMSDRPVAEVAARLRAMEERLAGLGVRVPSPFMALSFLALSVIPELKITDRGLIDVNRSRRVPLTLA
ncbi:MAG TPA: adenine deaminase [Candidatus Dormibacteraeota bacterium]|nr:adenine deaminase [Candidatus Dormibacteraeota bacterium]